LKCIIICLINLPLSGFVFLVGDGPSALFKAWTTSGGFDTILSTSDLPLRSSGFSHTDVLVEGLKKNTRPSPVHTTHL